MVKRKSTPKKNMSVTSEASSTKQESVRKNPNKKKPAKQSIFMGNKQFTIFKTTIREIKRLQSTVMNCIPRLPFSRFIRELLIEQGLGTHRIQLEALRGLQEAAEIYLTYLFEDANACAMHARRITLMPKDMQLVLSIRGCSDPGFS